MNGRRPFQAALGGALLLVAALPHRTAAVTADPVAIPATALILDDDIIFYSWPYPAISPDRTQVAYISRGFVCVASLADGTSRRLVEVPSTTTHVLTLPQYAPANGADNALTRGMSREEHQQFQALATNRVFGLQWTTDSAALAYGIRSANSEQRMSLYDFWIAPLDGSTSKLAHIEHRFEGPYFGDSFILSRDKRFIIADRRHPRPLIWDVARNRPRATPYLALAPSPTSGRWLAVEKDTRQVVILDEDFNVAQRFDELVPRPPVSDHMRLHWSPDERHMIWRIRIGFDHYSNWEGCRLDLQSKQRRILTGSYMDEEIRFTGRGGEFLRVGAEGVQGMNSGLISTSVYLRVVPQGAGFARDLWSKRASPIGDRNATERLGGVPPVVCSPDFKLFAIGLPRQEGPYGVVFHLLDRERRLWRLSPEDGNEYQSPYKVVGFAENNQTLIGHDETRLFAIPISAIQTPENDIRAAAAAERKAVQRQKVLPKSFPRNPNP